MLSCTTPAWRIALIRHAARCSIPCLTVDPVLHLRRSSTARRLHEEGEKITTIAGRLLPLSRRKQKRTRSSPSKALVEALQVTHRRYALPAVQRYKVDISYVNVRKRDKKRFRLELQRQVLQTGRRGKIPQLSLQTILAAYIKNRSVSTAESITQSVILELREDSLDTVFTDEANALLASRGYGPEDVKIWYRILTVRDVKSAAEILLLHGGTDQGSKHGLQRPEKQLPTFVFLFFLRRRHIDSGPLRIVLIYAWQQLHRKRSRQLLNASQSDHWEFSYPSTFSHFPVLNDSAMVIMLVRLVRHARRSWPEALVTIAAMFTQNVGNIKNLTRSSTSSLNQHAALSRITLLYNRMISLLSLPANLSPFHAVAYYQRAQFDVLKAMAEHDPALPVTREGYRAFTSVQLANKKTAREIDWANLKAKSWPPWKEDKTGLDAEKGVEYGTSRALETIHRAREAGYGGGVWEKAAEILAGWDNDQSPTIQTRALLLHDEVSTSNTLEQRKKHEIFSLSYPYHEHHTIWTARIKTTRTAQEAWACFLAHEDRGLPPNQLIYMAMFEKLYSEETRLREQAVQIETGGARYRRFDTDQVVPGDAKEVIPAPTSPKEATYVRTAPPTLDDLADHMFSKGVRPHGRCLAFMISHARNLTLGLKYVAWASRYDNRIASLLSSTPESDDRIHKVPHQIFSAFIKMLCRFPSAHPRKAPRQDVFCKLGFSPADILDQAEHPLILAYRLLTVRKPHYRPPWHAVLLTLAERRVTLYLGNSDSSMPATIMDRFLLMKAIRKQMKDDDVAHDVETFRIMCIGLERALLAADQILQANILRALPSSQNSKLQSTNIHVSDSTIAATAERMYSANHTYICRLFYDLMDAKPAKNIRHDVVRARTPQTAVPRLLATPRPEILHAFVRVLGLLRHWQGMLEFVRWMVTHQQEIRAAIEMPKNGPRMLRRTLIAMRVFLEGRWMEHNVENGDDGYSKQVPRVRSNDRNGRGDVKESVAPKRMIESIRKLVAGVDDWHGWPADVEVEEYCERGRALTAQWIS